MVQLLQETLTLSANRHALYNVSFLGFTKPFCIPTHSKEIYETVWVFVCLLYSVNQQVIGAFGYLHIFYSVSKKSVMNLLETYQQHKRACQLAWLEKLIICV